MVLMHGVRTTFAWQLIGPRRLERATLTLQPLTDRWARVRVQYCGLCGSDISHYNGRPGRRYPLSLGHEFVGVVDEIGRDVGNVEVGDVVITDLNYRCGSCLQCNAGRSHLCVEGQTGRHANRGFAGFVDLDASYLSPVTVGKLHPRLALAEPLSCALHALDWADPKAGDSILVIGAGGIGLCMLLALADRPSVSQLQYWDTNEARLAGVVQCAANFISAGPPDEHAYDIVFDLSGTLDGLSLACDSVRRGGTLCSMSHLDGASGEFLLPKLTRTDTRFKISYLNGDVENLRRAMQVIGRHWSGAFDALVSLHDVNSLPSVFAGRPSSTANKDIVDLRPWSNEA